MTLQSSSAPAYSYAAKDPNIAFLIEFVGGFFGLLGLGYFYVGRTNDGILRLVAWLIYDLIAACGIVLLLSIVIGLVCIPIQLVIQVGVPLWSAYRLKSDMTRSSSPTEPAAASVPPVLPPGPPPNPQ